jgi:hypothetical protein
MERFNGRTHAVTRRIPSEALEDERAHLHRIPDEPYSVAFGLSRTVSWSSTVMLGGGRYSVPHTLRARRVWVRVAGEEVVIVAGGPGAVKEVARHRRVGPGQASIDPAHYPERKEPADRRPKATNAAEAAFLSLGEGAKLWLLEAASVGTRGIEARMHEAVALARLVGADRVDEALGLAAMAGRFDAGDLAAICDARREPLRRADPSTSLQPGTGRWAGFSNGEARSPAPATIEPLFGEVEALCRRLRLRYVREQAPDVLSRQGPALGSGRAAPGAARGRGGGTEPLHHREPSTPGPLPGRQDLRHLGRDEEFHPLRHPTGTALSRVGPPA